MGVTPDRAGFTRAWLDLADGPVVLSVPDTHGRYYLMSLIDMWTGVFASVGARTPGTGDGRGRRQDAPRPATA